MEGDVYDKEAFCVDMLNQESSMKMPVRSYKQSRSLSELAGYESWAMTEKNAVE